MRFLYLLAFAGWLTCLGCSGSKRDPAEQLLDRQAEAPNAIAGKEGGGNRAPDITRKIIYTAQIELVVDDLDAARDKLTELVKEEKGIVAKSEISGSTGSRRTGRWTVRIPVSEFESFVDAVARLGEVQRRSTDSDDITDKYYDLKAQIDSKRVTEKRFLELQKSATNTKEVREIERDLERLRYEIDGLEGQVKKWDKLVELTTVTIIIHDRRDYVPPRSPKFTSTIGRTWEGSLEALTSFGKALVLIGVALTPWLPLMAVVVLPLWLWARRRRGRVQTETVLPAEQMPEG